MINPFKNKKGLGRGLSSLIGDSDVKITNNKISISSIIPNKYQPRKNFDKNSLDELTASNEVSMLFTAISPENGWRFNTLLATTHIPHRYNYHVKPEVSGSEGSHKVLRAPFMSNLERFTPLPPQ